MDEFVERFCLGKERQAFRTTVGDICQFAISKGAQRVIIGGSFVTSSPKPRDLDCLIVFSKQQNIPERTERLSIGGMRLDVLFCAADDPDVLSAFIHLFTHTRNEVATGVVSIRVHDDAESLLNVIEEPDPRTVEIVRRAYVQRELIDLNNQGKALVTIHGIRSQGEWNSEVVQVASSNGWIVAPFFYGYQGVGALSNVKLRDDIIDKLRLHIDNLSARYSAHVSVIAHSYGTYLIAKYLLGFDVVPYAIDTLILTGSILNKDLEIDQFRGRAACVVNEIAPNDTVVSWARMASLYKDDLIGNSGRVGFSKASSRLFQGKCEIFNHENVIRHDVVVTRWMPRLEAFVGKGQQEVFEVILEKVNSAESK
jgi:pimeloyl-ACP methyl ester carboxylesterase